jgi:diamine N-acetyltransferase
MEIKKAGIAEIGIIKNLAETIWPVCYATIITTEQLHYMLQLVYSENALLAQIEKGHQFIIAWENEKPIGFASYSQKSDAEKTTYRLHKIYVLPNNPTKGIGSLLLSYVCNASKTFGANTLELNVNKHNTAIQFYLKKGFTTTKEEVIDIGGGFVMDDYVMVKDLIS